MTLSTLVLITAVAGCYLGSCAAAPISTPGDSGNDDDDDIETILWKWRYFMIAGLAVLLGFIVAIVWLCLRHKGTKAKVGGHRPPAPPLGAMAHHYLSDYLRLIAWATQWVATLRVDALPRLSFSLSRNNSFSTDWSRPSHE
jgi:hypothetical protein